MNKIGSCDRLTGRDWNIINGNQAHHLQENDFGAKILKTKETQPCQDVCRGFGHKCKNLRMGSKQKASHCFRSNWSKAYGVGASVG